MHGATDGGQARLPRKGFQSNIRSFADTQNIGDILSSRGSSPASHTKWNLYHIVDRVASGTGKSGKDGRTEEWKKKEVWKVE